MYKCFYHSKDLDGWCSGAIVKKAHPDCVMIGIDYGDSFPWGEVSKDDIIVIKKQQGNPDACVGEKLLSESHRR